MKKKTKLLSSSIKTNDNKTIKILADLLKSKLNDELSIESIFHLPETFTVI